MFSSLTIWSRTSLASTPFLAIGLSDALSESIVWPENWQYISSVMPCIFMFCSYWLIKSSTLFVYITSGTSISALAITCSIRASSLSCCAFSAFSFESFSTSLALYSSNVSYSETSCAKSSLSSGSSDIVMPLSSTANTAGLPLSSSAWYSAGNVTFTSNLSPTECPQI